MISKKYLFAFLAFLVPLLVRAIPEVLMGPYIVGFDVMGHYVPTTILWLNGGVNLWSFVATAPLLYTLTVGLVLSGGPLLLVLKIVPSVLLGLLGLSIYGYANLGLGWPAKKSILPALIGTLYFVALRVSWDALREEIALIFVFVVLMLLAISTSRFSWKGFVSLSLALVAVILSNQVVAVLILGIVLFTVVHELIRKNRVGGVRLVLFSLPAVLLFFAIWYLSPAIPEYRLIFGFPQTNDGWLAFFGYSSYPAFLGSEAMFLLYCFLPLLPLAVLSARRLKAFQLRCWIVLVLMAAFIPMVSPSILRLLMLLTYPLAIYAVEGLSSLKSVNLRRPKLMLFRISALYLVLVTVILSFGFMLMPPENPFPYFRVGQLNGFVYQIPTSMLQNTVSISDCSNVASALQWFKGRTDSSAVLISHRVFYGWALSVLNSNQVILYEYGNPDDAALNALHEGHNQIYLIWWVNGQGWYGLTSVPSVFQEVHRVGKIAIYAYSP